MYVPKIDHGVAIASELFTRVQKEGFTHLQGLQDGRVVPVELVDRMGLEKLSSATDGIAGALVMKGILGKNPSSEIGGFLQNQINRIRRHASRMCPNQYMFKDTIRACLNSKADFW